MIRIHALRLIFLLALALCPAIARAQEAPLRDLMDAMRLADIADLMMQEGRVYADGLAEGPFPAGPSADWQEAVEALHAPGPLLHAVGERLRARMNDEEMRQATAFYRSPTGQDILARELSMRIAMAEPDVTARLEEAGAELRAEGGPIVQLIDELIEQGDLIDLNVTGAMNSSYHLMRGLAEGEHGAPDDEAILRMVWQDEPVYRASTERWLYGYLLAAYEGLSAEEIDAYLAFARSDAGRALTLASFEGFGAGLDAISYRLGLLAAEEMRQKGL